MTPRFILLSLGLLGVYSFPTSLMIMDRESGSAITDPADTNPNPHGPPGVGTPTPHQGTCQSWVTDIYDVSPPWQADPVLASGASCYGPCSGGVSFSYQTTSTSSYNIGFFGNGPNILSVLTASLTGGFSQSWSASQSKTVSETVECLGKDVQCGMQAIVTMVTTKGRQYNTCTNGIGGKPFRVDGVALVPGTKDVVIAFQSCILSMPANSTLNPPDIRDGIPDCPLRGGAGGYENEN